ncbi:MTHFSD family protein [Megaselia abdita]
MRKEKSTTSKSFQIPIFVDIEKANQLLAQTDEFKKATKIKINFDRPQNGIFVEALKADKTLFLSGDRKSVALLDKVDITSLKSENQEINEKSISEIFRSKNHKSEVPLIEKIELDLVIIGSIAVGKDGRRIGNENGFNDLELGILTHIGAITDKTLIVTTVHDDQIVNDLKSDIFEKFDYPVDVIVTPTQVLKIEKRLPRPEGIYWELLKERRVIASPTLQHLKTEEVNAGKAITLKHVSEDEENQKRLRIKRRQGFGTRPKMPNYRKRINKARHSTSVVGTVKDDGFEDEVEEKAITITKHSLRGDVWMYIKENKLAEKQVYKKIPIFTDYKKAIDSLTTLDVFKNSENIYTTNDLVFQPLKLNILKEKKSLYTPLYSGEDVLAKVKQLEEGEELTIEYVDSIISGKKFDLINMDNKVELDLVFLGSVLVSKDGRRIGNCNRITDLSFGYLVELGFITPKTKIVTLVHECQLQEFPENIMEVYDIPVDYIITPNEVIKVDNPLARPSGIIWEHINERQFKNSVVLQALKEKKEAAGDIITIKTTKAHRERPRSERRRRTKLGSGNRRIKRTTETSEVSEGGPDARPTNERRRNRRVGSTRKRLGGQKDKVVDEYITNDLKKTLKTRTRGDAYCVKVSNITPGIQAKEFKTEIRKLASPSFVNWNARLRSCLLHFNRKSVDNNEDGGIDNILRALENLSIDIETAEGETKTLSKMGIKLLNDRNFLESNDISRIESVDSTTV